MSWPLFIKPYHGNGIRPRHLNLLATYCTMATSRTRTMKKTGHVSCQQAMRHRHASWPFVHFHDCVRLPPWNGPMSWPRVMTMFYDHVASRIDLTFRDGLQGRWGLYAKLWSTQFMFFPTLCGCVHEGRGKYIPLALKSQIWEKYEKVHRRHTYIQRFVSFSMCIYSMLVRSQLQTVRIYIEAQQRDTCTINHIKGTVWRELTIRGLELYQSTGISLLFDCWHFIF
jgi:hypothetical protein